MKFFSLLFLILLTACGTTGEVTPPFPPTETDPPQEEVIVCENNPDNPVRCCDFDEQCPMGEVQFKDCSTRHCNLETHFCEWVEIKEMQDKPCEFSEVKGTCNLGVCNPL